MVIVSFLRFAMQKYSISQNENQLVKPFRALSIMSQRYKKLNGWISNCCKIEIQPLSMGVSMLLRW